MSELVKDQKFLDRNWEDICNYNCYDTAIDKSRYMTKELGNEIEKNKKVLAKVL